MYYKRRFLAVCMVLIMVLASSSFAFANSEIISEPVTGLAANPYEYGTAPEGKYVFLYHGYSPYFSMNIDHSMCIEDRLYVYDSSLDAVTQVVPTEVILYTATQDALYYVTNTMGIFKTNYSGSSHTLLYQSPANSIHNFSSYLNKLIFIENGNTVKFVDSTTGTASTILEYPDLDWIFMLSSTKFIAATLSEDCFTYDTTTNSSVALTSELVATDLINQAVLGAAKAVSADPSAVLYASTPTVTQANDISFPLSQYPATIYDGNLVNNNTYYRPISWFHNNGAEGCSSSNCKRYTGTGECEGFARYAHDTYLHIADNSIGYSAWKNARHSVETDYRFDGSEDQISSFFSRLKTGAYVRYGKDSDATPANGVHSIVFVCADSEGIWVYECNQPYDNVATHGCGVHFQYYTFRVLARKYQYVADYVNHTFTGTKSIHNTLRHRVPCSSCSGYLLQRHTGTITYSMVSSTQHRVAVSCCSGSILESHSFGTNRRCTQCGWLEGSDIWSIQ